MKNQAETFVFPPELVESINIAPLRRSLIQDLSAEHPLYQRMLCIDGAAVGFEDAGEWVTLLAMASFLEATQDVPTVTFTMAALTRRVNLHIQAARLAAGLEASFDDLDGRDAPAPGGGVN